MILFLIQFIFTNIIFSVIICNVLVRFNKSKIHSNLELLLYALGVGPIFTSLLLYYLFLFFPGRPNIFYLLGVSVSYLALLLLGKRSYSILWNDIQKKVRRTKTNLNKLDTLNQIELILFSSIIIIVITSFLFLYTSNTLQTPLDGSDALRYGTIGKILFSKKSLEYRWTRVYPETGFYMITNHAPSFPLLLTWEKIMNSPFKAEKDLFFKSISTYYSLLILIIIFFWISKKNKYLALLGTFALLSGFSFFQTLITQHLDSFRTFFLIISWIFLAYAIEKNDSLSFYLLGIYSGFAAFSHTIGAVIVIFNCMAIFIFIKGNFKRKLSKTFLSIVLIIMFGWAHYILDIFWGYGWIIFKREITYWG